MSSWKDKVRKVVHRNQGTVIHDEPPAKEAYAYLHVTFPTYEDAKIAYVELKDDYSCIDPYGSGTTFEVAQKGCPFHPGNGCG